MRAADTICNHVVRFHSCYPAHRGSPTRLWIGRMSIHPSER
jgi:hypothetical protein